MPDAPQNPAPQAVTPPATAQTAQPSAPIGPAGSGKVDPMGGMNILFLLLMIPLFWFLLIRPQQKQQKERKALLEALKKNDQVLTIGGVYGTVMAINDDQVTLRIDENKDVRIRIARGSIQGVVKSKGEEKEEAA